FLDALASDDAGAAVAAHAALLDLSGVRLRARAVVWRQWWKDVEAATPDRLTNALTLIEKGGAAGDFLDAEDFVARNAWVRLKDVESRVAAWMSAIDPELRREGYRMAAELR